MSDIGKLGVVFDLCGHAEQESDNIFSIEKVISSLVGKYRKRELTAHIKMTEYVDIALSDLVFVYLRTSKIQMGLMCS